MRYLLIFFMSINLLYASEIQKCQEYKQISTNIVGKSPPINMMIQTLKGYEFPQKISKKDEAFKKLSSVESLLNKRVDLVVLWNSTGEYSNLPKKLKALNIDSCSIGLDSIYDYVAGYETLGKIMNKQERAHKFSSYIDEKLKYISAIKNTIPEHKKLTLYYARGENGLESECENSVHSEVIELIGAINPLKCNEIKNMHLNINLEQLMLMNPDVIITANKNFFHKVLKEKKYRYLNAIKTRRVYLIPKKPINWIDNPPSFFKILGALWLAQMVYPDYYIYDFQAQKEQFFKLFLQEQK